MRLQILLQVLWVVLFQPVLSLTTTSAAACVTAFPVLLSPATASYVNGTSIVYSRNPLVIEETSYLDCKGCILVTHVFVGGPIVRTKELRIASLCSLTDLHVRPVQLPRLPLLLIDLQLHFTPVVGRVVV